MRFLLLGEVTTTFVPLDAGECPRNDTNYVHSEVKNRSHGRSVTKHPSRRTASQLGGHKHVERPSGGPSREETWSCLQTTPCQSDSLEFLFCLEKTYPVLPEWFLGKTRRTLPYLSFFPFWCGKLPESFINFARIQTGLLLRGINS